MQVRWKTIAVVLILLELFRWGWNIFLVGIDESNLNYWTSEPAISMPYTVAEIDAFRLVMEDEQGELSIRLQCIKPSVNRKLVVHLSLKRGALAGSTIRVIGGFVVGSPNTVQIAFPPTSCPSTGFPTDAGKLPRFLAVLEPNDTIGIGLEVHNIVGTRKLVRGVITQKDVIGTSLSKTYIMGTDGKLHEAGRTSSDYGMRLAPDATLVLGTSYFQDRFI